MHQHKIAGEDELQNQALYRVWDDLRLAADLRLHPRRRYLKRRGIWPLPAWLYLRASVLRPSPPTMAAPIRLPSPPSPSRTPPPPASLHVTPPFKLLLHDLLHLLLHYLLHAQGSERLSSRKRRGPCWGSRERQWRRRRSTVKRGRRKHRMLPKKEERKASRSDFRCATKKPFKEDTPDGFAPARHSSGRCESFKHCFGNMNC